MIKAAAWTLGLFGLGSVLCHFFPASWLEPLVLLGLGTTLLYVGSRTRAEAVVNG
jgi:hypothetical protein